MVRVCVFSFVLLDGLLFSICLLFSRQYGGKIDVKSMEEE